jgi:23S rRNA pseudouridine1911/1915/1917 synthase
MDEVAQETYHFVIDGNRVGERIDKFLVDAAMNEFSRVQWQQWIRQGDVQVNSRHVKSNYLLREGDEVDVRLPEPEFTQIAPEPLPIEIVFEDKDLVVVNKARGMVVHPSAGHASGTLVNALLYHCHDLSGIHGEIRPGIVHRIDKDTSGLLMAAKNDFAHIELSQQLKEHSVTRKYFAIAHGELVHDQGTIDAPIGRDPHDRKLFTVTDRGAKHAITHFVVVERLKGYTLLELTLETGRTHQIRVHMKYIGFPLVGDGAYGRAKGRTMRCPGQALHARVLGFNHPRTNERMTFEAAIPSEMQEFIDGLRLL